MTTLSQFIHHYRGAFGYCCFNAQASARAANRVAHELWGHALTPTQVEAVVAWLEDRLADGVDVTVALEDWLEICLTDCFMFFLRQCYHGQPMPGHPDFNSETPFCAECASARAFRMPLIALAHAAGVWPDTAPLPKGVIEAVVNALPANDLITWSLLKATFEWIAPGRLV